ncbi:MAG TPA: cytochrome c3 family protein [Pyrinomonadaceae bacterium]|nr:cytochrome c3 family protein [Pyrinomonadaceae bacterium]
MKNSIKLFVITIFGVFVLGLLLNSFGPLAAGVRVFAKGEPTPTPAANANKPANTPANTAPAATPASGGDGKKITKSFVLGKDSLSEYGEAPFDHETHAFQMYSPDGKSVVGCVECHHTDQPKSALKPPLLTSERDVALTLESWRASPQKVNECRSCHFQDGNVPDGKEMPTATYTDGAKSTKKDLNNELAYHINCNTCHDAAFKLRPELKKKPGFATSKDCTICHKTN